MLNEEMYQTGKRAKKALIDRLRYAVDCSRPEAALGLAVIEQSAFDIRAVTQHHRRKALSFIASNRFDFWCDLIELDPDYAREVIADHYPEILKETEDA